MSLGYFADLNAAKTHFTDNRPVTRSWDNLTDAQKTTTIRYSFNRLYHSPRWSLPAYADATADQLTILQLANAEMAYYIALHLDSEDRRKGLQAQNTIEAGVVKEKYDKDQLDKLPVPASVIDLLKPFETAVPFAAVDIDRDEDYSVDENVTDF